jgi:hypothetical protein
MHSIKCTVIITVFDRIQYIEDALNSIEDQKIDRDMLEVLIISNIGINLSREYDLNLKIVISDQKSLAGKLVQGILLAEGDIITFLEDDDIYVNNKVINIISVFNRYPDVDFYHNNFSHFKNIQNIGNFGFKKNQFLKLQSSLVRDSIKYTKLLYIKYNAGYNLSSMAVRKKFILGHLNFFELFENYCLDSLIFFISMAYGNSLYIDKNIQTMIRIHENNASGTINALYDRNNCLNINQKIKSEFQNVNGKAFLLLLILFIYFYVMNYKIKTGKYKRSELLILLLKYSISSFRLRTMPQLYIIVSSLSAVISYNTYKKVLLLYHKV